MKKLLSLMVILVLCISFVPLNSIIKVGEASPEPATIVVPDDYLTIQEAINAANEGDTIFVYNGTYYENVVVNKAVSLIGEDKSITIVDGSGTGNVVTITQENVNITGFTIRNSGASYLNAGIYLDNANHCNITNNNITNNLAGIWLDESSNNSIIGNNITANNWDGIRLSSSSNNSVSGNNITNNYYGVKLDGSSNNIISGNTFFYNGLYVRNSYANVVVDNLVNGKPLVYLEDVSGFKVEDAGQVILVSCTNITVEKLNLSNTGIGIQLLKTKNSTISGNNITNNGRGIFLRSSNYNSISGNNIANNEFGIMLYESSNYNSISGNNITANDWHGICLWRSSNNSMIRNNITANKAWSIYLYQSHNSSITENNITNNEIGIWLDDSSNNSIIKNNITANKDEGIYLYYSINNSITGNKIANNEYGVHLCYSRNNILKNNVMAGNRYNFGVSAYYHTHLINDIDTSNTVDGKPVYYLTNQNNLLMNPSTFPNVGYLALVNSTYITVERLELKNNGNGILLAYTQNIKIKNTNITNNRFGVYLWGSSNISFYGNNISNNKYGVTLSSSLNNSVCGNNIVNNEYGVDLWESSNNVFYHNNFIGNGRQAYQEYFDPSINVWDNGYPSGGNYWSDYVGVDEKSGPNQDQPGSDGIGDTAYTINTTDRFPLAGRFTTFGAGTWDEKSYFVDVVSNSTVSGFFFNPHEGPFIRFNVTGENGTRGFCRVTIPEDLLSVEDGWTVYVGDRLITDYTKISDENYTYLYFTYNHSTKTVQIIGTDVIPEFPSAMLLPLFIFATLTATTLLKKKRKAKPQLP